MPQPVAPAHADATIHHGIGLAIRGGIRMVKVYNYIMTISLTCTVTADVSHWKPFSLKTRAATCRVICIRLLKARLIPPYGTRWRAEEVNTAAFKRHASIAVRVPLVHGSQDQRTNGANINEQTFYTFSGTTFMSSHQKLIASLGRRIWIICTWQRNYFEAHAPRGEDDGSSQRCRAMCCSLAGPWLGDGTIKM